MALPSQMERTNDMSRPIMTRASRGQNRAVVGALALLVLAGGAYALYRYLPSGATSPATVNASAPELEPTGGTVTPPPRSIAPSGTAALPANPEPAPMVLTQGRGAINSGVNESSRPRPVDVTGGKQTGPGPQPLTIPNTTPGATTPVANAANGGSGAPGTVPTLTPSTSTMGSKALIEAGDRAFMQNNMVAARQAYSKALMNTETAPADQDMLRSKLTTINEDLVFSPKVVAGDPLVETYTVASGDSLERIRRKRDLATDWHLIARVNRMSDPHALKVGQRLKLVRGPFNVIVHKGLLRLDLFTGSPDDMDSWLYVRSFKVGLGKDDGTPVGVFVIKNKMSNPDWKNPKTGEYFAANDPKNPIGEYWMGWEGLGDSKVHKGFGLHGTIDPTSIGDNKSMGCVRLGDEDVKLMYELLVEKISEVRVMPN